MQAQPQEADPGLVASYTPDPRRWDELLTPDGAVREVWQGLLGTLSSQPAPAHRRALQQTRRLITGNGVTYNVYADPQGTERPWTLDPLPALIAQAEWQVLEAGLKQRARLLELLLADLYGPQQLLAQGLVPAELPFGHPNFLWPCAGITPRPARWLPLYAADLARGPQGDWWVLGDRTQAPSGAGYALENREITGQVLAEPLAQLPVRRIGGFFDALRAQLCAGADEGETPLAVVLTPGPFNETYFEHAYLAGQLGIPLVEGSDLTVRADTVYLKTLAGLKRVHSLLRRLDDDYCDPVELRSDSALGVAGLLGAVRAGRVQLANALGTGVLESAAWLAFLPRIAPALLGEALRLPTVPTWWCGERPALEHVLAHLDQLVIKPAYPNQRFEPVFAAHLRGEARARLVARLLRHPHAYVGQAYIRLSQTPAWAPGAGALAARPMSIRAYCLSSAAGQQVLPGGLARVAAGTAEDVVSSQRGGGSKDVWVLAAGHDEEAAEPATWGRRSLTRSLDVPSRLVDNLYWLGRLAVRCDNKARLLRRALRMRDSAELQRWAVTVCCYFGVTMDDIAPAQSLYEERNPLGVLADVRRLAWCASQVRGRLPERAWRALADLQHHLNEALSAREEPRTALDDLLRGLAALTGFALEDMTQDAPWRLMCIGRRLERLQFVADLLAQLLSSAHAREPAHLEWLLDACDCTRVYRSRHAAIPCLSALLDLLVRDAQQPRSLESLGRGLAQDLAILEATLAGADPEAQAGPLALGEPVPALTDETLIALQEDSAAAAGARAALAAQLRALAGAAGALSDEISLRHFTHMRSGSQMIAT